MSILIFIIIVLVVLSLAIWVIRLLPLPAPINTILQVIAVIMALVAIGNRAGLF